MNSKNKMPTLTSISSRLCSTEPADITSLHVILNGFT